MRGKLTELIIDGFRNCTKPHEVCSQLDLEALADHLIAHGVTLATDTNVGDKKPLTNGDRIRAMTDEELAYWMTHLHEDGHCLNERCQVFRDSTCEECVVDWLKQEGGNNG